MGNVELKSNKAAVLRKLKTAMNKSAKMIGGTVESHAKELCPVDTGLLRNSITYALSGEAPAIGMYTDDSGEKSGVYEGAAPTDDNGKLTVYIGTNVYYAPYQELGAPSINLPAKPYLRPGFENSSNEIEQIIKMNFKGLN